MNRCNYRPKVLGVLYNHGGKPGTHYPDLEPGNEFWNWVQVPGSGYKSLVTSTSSVVTVADDKK